MKLELCLLQRGSAPNLINAALNLRGGRPSPALPTCVMDSTGEQCPAERAKPAARARVGWRGSGRPGRPGSKRDAGPSDSRSRPAGARRSVRRRSPPSGRPGRRAGPVVRWGPPSPGSQRDACRSDYACHRYAASERKTPSKPIPWARPVQICSPGPLIRHHFACLCR
jgi:hypothetical protein